MGEAHSATAYHAHGNQIDKLREITAKDSIGILYSVITLHLGFDFNSDEYKIMGLAPYGNPARYRHFFEQAVELLDNGTIKIPILRLNEQREDRETYGATRRYLEEHLIPKRAPDSEITDDHRDVAAALQECLDKVMLHICGHFGRATGLRRLAMAGGVALNCTANGRLLQSGIFDDIYVQPAAGDDGTALGAALWRASRNGGVRNYRFPVPFYGPAATQAEIDAAIAQTGDRIERHPLRQSPGRLRRSRQAHQRRPRPGLVSRPHGVRPPRAGPPQHPSRSGPRGNARPHQRHGQNARSLPPVRPSGFPRASPGLVRGPARHGIAVHDHDRRRSPANSAPRYQPSPT